jgi:glucosamine-6-phosphate deaminase
MELSEMLAIPTEDLHAHTRIPIAVLPDLDAFYRHVARHMADIVAANNRDGRPTSFILPVGPTGQYPQFARIVNAERIDCRNLTTFNMDEYLDWQGKVIPESHPMNFRRTMRELLFDRIEPDLRWPAERMFFPDPRDLEAMDEAFDAHGPADACYAGVGYHGHVAFNEGIVSRWYKVPEAEFLAARTHIVALADDTFVINSVREAGGNCQIIPPFAVTIGMADILASRHIEGVFYCGHWQRTTFRRTLFQEPTVEYPGTFLKQHPSFGISIDAVTAAPPEARPF